MSGIGEELTAAREARGLTVEEAEDKLKIRRRFLHALENEQWEVLPGASYARSFLRTYGDFLGLDGEELAGRLREQQHDESVELTAERELRERGRIDPGRRPQPKATPGLPRPPWRRIAVVAAAIAAVTLVTLVVVSAFESEPGPSTTATSEPSTSEPSTTPEPSPPEPSHGRVRLTATGTVWACVVDGSGKVLVDGETLSSGEERGPFKADRIEMNFGNGLLELVANGKPIPIQTVSDPVGFEVTASRVRDLPEGERPTCE
jgi:transcriptional regulator with XRE-family HTH domain